MILFGAGSSVPFDIPGMTEFTEKFIDKNKDMSEFLMNIKDAIDKSEEMVGISFSFDLETLLSVLNDLSGVMKEKPITIPTTSLLLEQGLNIKIARGKFRDKATVALERLREFIFNTCMQPNRAGKEKGDFEFLDRFYGPLMTVLNKTDMKNIQDPIRRVFSTNWDLCFKTWVDYVNIEINDGTIIDRQSNPVFDVRKFDSSSGSELKYVPLHGSLDLVKTRRPKGEGSYEDISKISDPIGYFEDKPANMKDVFIIYPLEAIGYEESVKSPYLDMLYTFRSSLRDQSWIFVIGYSLRDPTIGSIFEEVITERIKNGEINLLSEDFDSRKKEIQKHRLKIIVIDPNPDKLAENLKKQSFTKLLQTFVPIKIRFPRISDKDFDAEYTKAISQLVEGLEQIGYMEPGSKKVVTGLLTEKYNIGLESATSFGKKPE